MNKFVNRHTDAELKAYPIKNILNGWCFRIDEISYGFYRVTGIDELGSSVTRDGNDPDELMQICKQDILEMFSKGIK